MIKCDGFGKLLKLSFFTLLISCFGLLGGGYVNGIGAFTTVSTSGSASAVNGNYNISFFRKGGLLTQYIGQARSVIALDNNVLFRRTPNGFPYFYSSYAGYGFITQGFFKDYYLCDSLSGYVLSGCVYGGDLTGDYTKDVLKDFFSTINDGDLVYYDFQSSASSTPTLLRDYLKICWSSSQYNKSLCFFGGYEVNGREVSPLIDSQNYQNLTFGSIPYNSIGYAPGQVGYGGNYEGVSEGSSQGSFNVYTGDYIYMSCTYGDILTLFETEGYNKYICYGGIDNFDLYNSSLNYSIIPGSGKSILSIWGHSSSRAWDNFGDFFRFWDGIYLDENNNYTAMWESYPAVYRSYFQLYNQYKGETLNPDLILDYCNIKLSTIDLSLSATGSVRLKTMCDYVIQEKQTGIWDKRVSGNLYDGVYTGDVPVSVNWNGVGSMSGLSVQKDGINFLQDFFNIIKLKVPSSVSTGSGGFLPTYILVFLCGIVLFRFISH